MQAGGVLFLTSLSSPGGLYGHSLCRERARAFSTPSFLSGLSLAIVVVVVVVVIIVADAAARRRRRRGFPRQYANAFQRRSDE